MKRSLNKVYYVAFVAVAVKLNLEPTIKSTTVSVRLILPKVGVDEFTWPQRNSGVRKQNDL